MSYNNSHSSRSAPALRAGKTLEPASRNPRLQHRERDFGIGYGNSSGYGRITRYVEGWTGSPRFRCG